MLKFAVAGTGFAKKVVLPALARHPRARATAISSGREDRARETAAEFDLEHYTTSFEDLLDTEPDAVIITTPTDLHRPMALAAIERGIHVLCEKPMALDSREAEEMYRAAESAGVVAAIDFEFRYLPVRARMTELVEDGFLGEITVVSLSGFTPHRSDPNSPWSWWSDAARGGGALGASASHFIDALMGWCGPIERVAGGLETVIRERPDGDGNMRRVDSDDSYAFSIRFSNGALGNLVYGSAVAHPQPLRIALHGTEGTLVDVGDEELLGARRDETLAPLEIPERLRLIPGGGSEGDLEDSYWLEAPFLRLLDRFISAAADVRAYDGPSFEDGLRVQRVLDAVRMSHASGWIAPSDR